MRHLILISGKDSLAAALVQTARHPGLTYEYLFTDVMAELPETYAWLSLVEKKTGWTIQRNGKSLPDLIAHYNGFLPSQKDRYCTYKTKIAPVEKLIGKDDCTVYYGLRADESRTGYIPIGKPNITPAYPLRDAGIDLQGVYAILDAQGLTPPIFLWPRLYAAVAKRLSTHEGWEAKINRMERQILFAGRSRANCYFCFFQRRYEWVWLYETHPDLFAQAESLEKADYSFSSGGFLRELRDPEKREGVFNRRVSKVCSTILRKFQGLLFDEPADNELSLVSCGLLCGK